MILEYTTFVSMNILSPVFKTIVLKILHIILINNIPEAYLPIRGGNGKQPWLLLPGEITVWLQTYEVMIANM